VEADPRLLEHRRVWDRKPALRAIYADYYRRMAGYCRAGPTLEIGSGSGHIRDHLDEVYMADILPAPWLDLAADAEALPFAAASLDNIVMLDVLHHIRRPLAFFEEAVRVLRPGGRLVMLDPAITPGSWPVYKFLHPEPVDLSADPLAEAAVQSGADPFDSNQAVPSLLFSGAARQARFAARFPDLKRVACEKFGFAAYPLSGGFRDWCLLPEGLVAAMLGAERAVEGLFGRVFGFRLLVALERN
jgi:SAM-dependent methyltransferase